MPTAAKFKAQTTPAKSPAKSPVSALPKAVAKPAATLSPQAVEGIPPEAADQTGTAEPQAPHRPRRERLRARAKAAAEAALRASRDWIPVETDSPDDPRGAPQASGGWSETVDRIDNALVVPTSGEGMIQIGGVYDRKGAYVHQAVHWRRGRPLLLAGDAPPPRTRDRLEGNWLWGGLLLNHFGHFLTESTPRLWALDEVTGLDGIVFVHKRNAEVTHFHRSFLRLMGCDLPIHVVNRPVRVDRLHVPGQGFGIGRITQGTPKFRDFFQRSFARDIAPEGPERLYISRSALGPRKGGALGEGFLEKHLATEGYEAFHPQQHPLEVQIARYRAARQIIALDGSALHLAAFACAPHQRVAMIRRRTSSISNTIVLHLNGFSGGKTDVIDAIRADWVLGARGGRVDRFSMGELDMPAVQAALKARGYVGDGPVWPALDAGWRDAQIARLKEEHGLDYTALPRNPGEASPDDGDDDDEGSAS